MQVDTVSPFKHGVGQLHPAADFAPPVRCGSNVVQNPQRDRSPRENGWRARGQTVKRKVAPGPWFGTAHNRPPWFSMIDRLIERPIPMPPPFVV